RPARGDLHPARRARPPRQHQDKLIDAYRHGGAAADIPPDRAWRDPETHADAAGDTMARAGTADLLRVASDAVDTDTCEGGPRQGAGRRRRRRAVPLRPCHVAAMSRAAAHAHAA